MRVTQKFCNSWYFLKVNKTSLSLSPEYSIFCLIENEHFVLYLFIDPVGLARNKKKFVVSFFAFSCPSRSIYMLKIFFEHDNICYPVY
jgi:hypothetical protein